VLTGTGGISDMVADILAACAKDTSARVIYESDPQHLVEELLRIYQTAHFRRPSCFHLDRDSGADASSGTGRDKDPVCGMWIVPQAAVSERTFEGTRYLFCSTDCAQRFETDPQRYLSQTKAVARATTNG
jgi:YHS domain-containing protein